jgi:hypothetical protein
MSTGRHRIDFLIPPSTPQAAGIAGGLTTTATLFRRNSHGLRPGGYAQAMTNSAIQLKKYLGGVDYPVDKDALIQKARDNGAGDDVIQTLQSLPVDSFNSPNDVSEAFGKK